MTFSLLFSPTLINQSVKDTTPAAYKIRPLARDDYAKGFFECLRALTWTGEPTQQQFQERYDWMTSQGGGWFYNVVIEHENKIVGTGVVIIERKFIWNLGMVGHLEDISILKDHQGKGIGRQLIAALDSVAKNVGCTKTILNCSAENEAFYAKCGFVKSGSEMKHEFEKKEDS